MRVMSAQTPAEKAAEALAGLLRERDRIDNLIRQALRIVDNGPTVRRSRLVVPECGSESSYQRHAHSGDTANDKRRVTCEPCLAAHRTHSRVQYARAKLKEAS